MGGRIGRYVLIDKLGQGTFGLVFLAHDTVLDRHVAIKVLNPAHEYNAEILCRFLQEALASARAVHPGIVTVHDYGTCPTSTGETAYIVLELLRGESLSARLAKVGRLPAALAVEIVRQVASALDAAHRAGVLHRDLKSDNIYLVHDPAAANGERVKVLDFGLAKVGAGQHTQHNTVFGTPRYMSPEQCRSATEIDQRSDIYSLGCVMFELLTGRTPFTGELRTLLHAHKHAIAPRARAFVPEVPEAVDELLAGMLAKDPAARPASMAALYDALVALTTPIAPAPAMALIPQVSPVRPAALDALLDGASSGAFTAIRSMPVAATVLPTAAELLVEPRPIPAPLPRSKPRSSQLPAQVEPAAAAVVALPSTPSVRYHLAPHLPSLKRSPVRASIAGAAITLLIAAVLTAIAARGQIKPAAAAPSPVPVMKS